MYRLAIPLAVLATAFLFATLETGALGMQRDAGLPSTLAAVLEACAILLVLGLGARVPAAAQLWRGRSRQVAT